MIFDYNSYGTSHEKNLLLVKEIYLKVSEWTIKAETRFNIKGITLNQSIAYDAIRKSYEDMLRYRKSFNIDNNIDIPDHFKEAAHLSYWIRRLRPFGFEPDSSHNANIEYQEEYVRWINERLALYFIEFLCVYGEERHGGKPKVIHFPDYLKKDFLHMFRYKHVSPHSLMLILRSIF